MIKPKYLGTISNQYIEKLGVERIWEAMEIYDNPFPTTLVTLPKSYLLTLGSSCPVSLATTSSQGITYNASYDLFRLDYSDEYITNIDQYVASYIDSHTYALIKMPPTRYHHPKPNDPIYKKLSLGYQFSIKYLLKEIAGIQIKHY